MTEFERYLACPECKSDLKYFPIENLHSGWGLLLCGHCKSLFPVSEGIPVLLKSTVRSAKLESPLFEQMETRVNSELKTRIAAEKEKLSATEFKTSWEWEDVEFWDNLYQQQWEKLLGGDKSCTKALRARVLQRVKEMKIMCRSGYVPDGIILEVGAGTAVYTEKVLDTYPNHFYISVDMSLHALKVRRRVLSRTNAMYVLSSIDNLPFRVNSVGIMLLLGILHHSERKETTLTDLKDFLVPGGIIYLNEAIERPSFLKHDEIVKGLNISLHEEKINYLRMMEILSVKGSVEYHIIFNTPFYQFALRYMRSLMTHDLLTYRAFCLVDKFIMKTLGLFLPSCKAGEVSVLWRKASFELPNSSAFTHKT